MGRVVASEQTALAATRLSLIPRSEGAMVDTEGIVVYRWEDGEWRIAFDVLGGGLNRA